MPWRVRSFAQGYESESRLEALIFNQKTEAAMLPYVSLPHSAAVTVDEILS